MDKVITLVRTGDPVREALRNGYITTKDMLDLTGLTQRKLHYWEACGVFGKPVYAGSGNRRMWHSSLVKIVLILKEVSDELSEFNSTSTTLLKRIVDNFDNGYIQFSENTRLEWRV